MTNEELLVLVKDMAMWILAEPLHSKEDEAKIDALLERARRASAGSPNINNPTLIPTTERKAT